MKIKTYLIIVLILILSLLLMAMQVAEVSDDVIKWISMLVAFILGFFSTSPINWFKEKLGVDASLAVILVWVLSGVVGILALALAGAFTEFTLNWESVVAFMGVFFPAATLAYERLKGKA